MSGDRIGNLPSSSTTTKARFHQVLYGSIIVGFLLAQTLVNNSFTSSSSAVRRRTTTSPQSQSQRLQQPQSQSQRTPKLADGCFHVLLDVGANRGVHGRFLFEPDQYPLATTARKLYRDEFGADYDNRDVCVFAFEPNPAHHERLTDIQQAYAKQGWRYTVLPFGVSDQDGVLEFHRRPKEADKEDWGFTAVNLPNEQASGDPVKVPVIRLAQWIQDHVHDRTLPTRLYGKYNDNAKATATSSPKVIMKMDIEGLEFRVFPDLLFSGVFCNGPLDLVFGEVHFGTSRFPMQLADNVVLNDKQHARAYWQVLLHAHRINPACHGRFWRVDDESYLHDGVPLPGDNTAMSAAATATSNKIHQLQKQN